MNLRPLGPQPSALPDCATPRGVRLHSDESARGWLRSLSRGGSSTVEPQPSKLMTRVRFPSAALFRALCGRAAGPASAAARRGSRRRRCGRPARPSRCGSRPSPSRGAGRGRRSPARAGRGATCGSCSKTSRPAEAISPARSASTRAASSTTGPRAVLTRVAVGFIARSSRGADQVAGLARSAGSAG